MRICKYCKTQIEDTKAKRCPTCNKPLGSTKQSMVTFGIIALVIFVGIKILLALFPTSKTTTPQTSQTTPQTPQNSPQTAFLTSCEQNGSNEAYCTCAYSHMTAKYTEVQLAQMGTGSAIEQQVVADAKNACKQLNTPLALTDKIKVKLPNDFKDVNIDSEDAVSITNGQATDTTIPGKKAIVITEKQGSGFWDTKMAREGGWTAMTEITKDVFPVDESIYSITLIVQAPVTDAYGKNGYAMLETMTFTRDTYNKIDYTNFNSKNVPTIADIYTENNTIH